MKELDAKRKFEEELTEYVRILYENSDLEMQKTFAAMRNIPLETVIESGIFYVGNMVEMIVPAFISKLESFGVISPTNNKPIFSNRYIIPIKNADGLVQNLVGYSKEADERYIYGTAEYYRRRETLYGLENLGYAYEVGWAILTEGITDTIRYRSLGYKNSFAMCGTHKSEHIMKVLNRCRYGIIRVPDRDEAGALTRKHWKVNRFITLNTPINYKDADETVSKADGGEEWMKQYIDACVNWLMEKEHKGIKCPTIEATMI